MNYEEEKGKMINDYQQC